MAARLGQVLQQLAESREKSATASPPPPPPLLADHKKANCYGSNSGTKHSSFGHKQQRQRSNIDGHQSQGATVPTHNTVHTRCPTLPPFAPLGYQQHLAAAQSSGNSPTASPYSAPSFPSSPPACWHYRLPTGCIMPLTAVIS